MRDPETTDANDVTQWTKSTHFKERQRRRFLSDEVVRLTLAYGEKFFQGSQTVYFLSRRRIRRAEQDMGTRLDDKTMRSADGAVVVAAQDRTLVTVYRNPKYWGHLRRCS
jgi:hypothetical protein